MITIMAGIAQNTAYATNIITVQRYFYKQIWSYSYQIMLVLSTQLIGFSMGAFCWKPLLTRLSRLTCQSYPSRWPLETLPCLVRLLVYLSRFLGLTISSQFYRPAQMIWPASLVSTALLNTLHSMGGGGSSTSGSISRDKVRCLYETSLPPAVVDSPSYALRSSSSGSPWPPSSGPGCQSSMPSTALFVTS